jgi:RNA polymerase sigma-70 factor (ECF subfamily)
MAETFQFAVDQNASRAEDVEMVLSAQESLAGFKRLYLKWLPPVYRYFYYRMGDVKDAEDLTAQVFLKVYEELPRYRDRGQFSAWLFTIVRHKMVDFLRSQKPTVSLEFADEMGQPGDLLGQAIRNDEIERLQKLIRSLPEEERELIHLRFVVGLGYREIGALLNRNEDAVRKTLSRLLARLESRLEMSHE